MMIHKPKSMQRKDDGTTRRAIGRQWLRGGARWHTLAEDGDLPEQRRGTADVVVDCAVYEHGCRVASLPPGEALAAARKRPGGFAWIGLYEPEQEHLAEIAREFGLHPLAVEDALKAHQRPKLEVYHDSVFVVLKPVDYDDAKDTVTASELMVFVGDSFVVTVRHGHEVTPAGIRQRLEAEHEMLKHGPCAVMYAIADTVVDRYLLVATQLQTDLEELEALVFEPATVKTGGGRAAGSVAGRIYGFKREVLEFRRSVGPLTQPVLRLASGGVPFVEPSAQPFFRDVADHLTRVNDQVEGMDRLLSDILGAHLTQVGVRQNDDMRKISAWAAMAAVPTMIAGVYGMNFDHMPELHQVWGYPAALLAMAAAVFGLYRLFKRRGWL
jgi:magnesium transporter